MSDDDSQQRLRAEILFATAQNAVDTVRELLASDPDLTGAQVLEYLEDRKAELLAEKQRWTR
jgi:hypothetical protein